MAAQVVNSFAIKSISSMYLNPEYADVHFIFPTDDRSEKIPAHRNILATVSPVFSRMFYGPLKEGDTVEIDDSNAGAFKEFLQIIYLPEISFTMGNIVEVVRLADKYDMVKSLEACIIYLESQATSENAVIVYELAVLLDKVKLKQFCETLIRISTIDVLKSDAFLQCNQKMVEHILRMDKLQCNEIILFKACMKWAAFSCQKIGVDQTNSKNLRNQLGNCFHLIRFGAMEENAVSTILANEIYKDLFNINEITDLFRMKIDSNFQSVIFNNTKRAVPIKSMLICEGKCPRINKLVYLQQSVWFSTNELVKLKSIYFATCSGTKFPSNSEVIIIEYHTDIINTDAPPKTLHQAINTNHQIGSGAHLSLIPPIIINPLMMYEIRVLNVPKDYYDNCSVIKQNEIKLNDKITINFHGSSNKDDMLPNLVPKLTFIALE